MARRIAHLDMDAFYASVELLRYPQLRGLPVVVGGRRRRESDRAMDATTPINDFVRLRDYVGRGVATTATYEARALGLHSALGLMKAAALAPDAILLPADFDEYIRYSRRFKAAVAEIAPHIEDRGIDEIYIDLTDVPGESASLAQRIKDNIKQATGLSCSIGITPNKLLSKIASELEKPNGLTVLSLDDVPSRIWPLPCRKINGIGPRSGAKLEALGFLTIGHLAQAPVEFLVAQFGNHYGRWLVEVARGQDDRPVVTEREPKSISRETTFERDLDPKRDREKLSGILLELCEKLSGDLKRKGYRGKTIGMKLRYADFRTLTRDTTLSCAIDDTESIRDAVRSCLKRVPLDARLRLLGVRVAALAATEQASETNTEPKSKEDLRGTSLSLFE
jgi:DNA polymerase IV